MPGKGKMPKKKGKNDGHSEREKDKQQQRSPSPPLTKRMKIEELKLDSDQSASSSHSEVMDIQMPLVEHLDKLALDEVKCQMNTFSLLQLATVNRRFSHVLAGQGNDVKLRLSLLQNDFCAVNIRDGSQAKVHRKIDHSKLAAFLKNVFQRLKVLREITTSYRLPDLCYRSLLRALIVHQVKVHRLHLRDEAMTLVHAKWQLLSYCGPHLHQLGLWQSVREVPHCIRPERPYESYEAEYSTDKIEAFEKCAKLRRFRLVGWLTPTTVECIGQLKQLRRLDLDAGGSSDSTFTTMLDILAMNDKLRHLTVSYDWQHLLASHHAAKLLSQLKSFGFRFSEDRSLEHFTAVTLPPWRHHFLDMLTMIGPDGRVNIGIRFLELFSRGSSSEQDQTIVKNFIAHWLQLSSSAGGSLVVLKILNGIRRLLSHLLVSVDDQAPIQLKQTFPTDWKVEKDRTVPWRFTIHYQGGSVALQPRLDDK